MEAYHYIYLLSTFFCPAAACGSDLRASVTLPYTWLVDFRSVYSPRIHFSGIRWTSYHLRGEVDSRSIFSPKMYCIWQIIFRYILYMFFLTRSFAALDICTSVYYFICPAAGMFWPDRTNRSPRQQYIPCTWLVAYFAQIRA